MIRVLQHFSRCRHFLVAILLLQVLPTNMLSAAVKSSGVLQTQTQVLPTNMLSALVENKNNEVNRSIKEAFTTLRFDNENLVIAFKKIEEATGFGFSYNITDVKGKKVSGEFINQSLFDILVSFSHQLNLRFRQYNDMINVKVRKQGQKIEEVEIAKVAHTVQGTITGQGNGEPLPGVNILVKNTNIGTVTDVDGKYNITVPDENNILVFSFIGYTTQEVSINGRTTIDVALAEDVQSLEEVVVVGYGTQKKASVTGSVASVDSEEIKSITTSNLVTGLAGKLPGLRVTQRNSEPGAYSTAFDIRGFGTPLIVVDGIVRNDFNKYDPNEIESITILKDASAAVYGVQAANGVILVTTKKGHIGKPVISYSVNYELQEILNTPKVMDAYQFAVLTTENEINLGNPPGSTTYTSEDIQKFKDGTYPSTDWLDVLANKYGKLTHHNLNITGGSERIKYFTSVGYLDEMGIYKSGDLNYQKYNIRSSVTGNITDNLTAQLNIDAMLENRNEPSYTSPAVFHFTWMNKPTFPIYANNTAPYMQDFTYPFHPLAVSSADIGGYRKTNNKTFQGNFNLEYKFKNIDGLAAKFMYGFYNNDVFQKLWNKKYSVYTYDPLSDTYLATGTQNSPSRLSGNYSPLQRSTVLGQLTYEKLFLQKHNVKASVVYEERHAKSDNMWASKEFAIDVDQFFAGVSQNAQVSSSNIYENANQNMIGRLNYDYSSKYFLEFGFNYGGSSKFPKGERWGFFPYASAGWTISEEKFFRDRSLFISDLKIRGSWGQMGDDGASSFQFLTGYNYPSGNYIFNNKVVSGLGFRGMPNPNITWFTVTTKNIGVDLSLFEGLISMEFDLFQRDRSGLLATRNLTIPQSVGATLPQENLNKDMRRGFEFVISHTNRLNELTYNVSANITYTRGQQTYIERASDGNSYLNWRNNATDRWDNMVWGYKLLGQFQTQEDVLAAPIQDGQGNRTLRPGNLKYEDLNKDGIVDNLDQIPISRGTIPDINFGLNINLIWRKFDLNIFAQGASGFNIPYNWQMMPLHWGRNSHTMFFDRWHHEDIFNTDSPWIPGKYPPINYVPSDKWPSVFWRPDATYVRLKNLEIGYTVENSFLKKAGIQNMRINFTGFNLFTYTRSELEYLDPEQDTNRMYPITKNYNIGLNVTF
jgi:TonB-linked SusC/RagA family outer membrane protein